MRTAMFLTAFFLSIGCVGCSNSQESDQSNSNKRISSDLDKIERAFDKGDISTACDLQIQLSKKLIDYEKISPKLIRSIQQFEVKCGSRSFSIDFLKEKN